MHIYFFIILRLPIVFFANKLKRIFYEEYLIILYSALDSEFCVPDDNENMKNVIELRW